MTETSQMDKVPKNLILILFSVCQWYISRCVADSTLVYCCHIGCELMRTLSESVQLVRWAGVLNLHNPVGNSLALCSPLILNWDAQEWFCFRLFCLAVCEWLTLSPQDTIFESRLYSFHSNTWAKARCSMHRTSATSPFNMWRGTNLFLCQDLLWLVFHIKYF